MDKSIIEKNYLAIGRKKQNGSPTAVRMAKVCNFWNAFKENINFYIG